MRDDLFRVTISSTVAQLRRAVTFHPTSRREGAPARAPQRQTPAARPDRAVALDAGRSLTERQLQVLGVGQPPDRAETGDPGASW